VAFDLIIFDCDGVLVDSEVISCRAHAGTLTETFDDMRRLPALIARKAARPVVN
jgi:beta-phosphoglucomutase-like phosphatase (HAD superfamily)